MTSNKEMLKAVQAGTSLYVTKKHAEWLERPEDQQIITEQAAEFVKQALLGKFRHERTGRFSPSSAGGCKRRALFSFYGAPQLGDNLDSYDLMGLGTWGHLRWQAEGLSYPYMHEGEVWVYNEHLLTGGSIDAALLDDSLFELKTVMGGKMNKVLKDEIALLEHRLQVEIYFELSGADIASILYEDRATGSFHEFRYRSDPKTRAQALEWMERLNAFLAADTLPDMLDDCEMRQGSVYRNCPYRKHCPLVAKGERDKRG